MVTKELPGPNHYGKLHKFAESKSKFTILGKQKRIPTF